MAEVILVAGGIAAVLALLNVFYFYWSAAERHFTSRAGIVWYCVPPLALAFVCFGALRLRPTHKQWVALLCVAFAAMALGSEVTVFLIGRYEVGSLHELVRFVSNGKTTIRDADHMVAELRKSGVSAVRSVVTPVVLHHKSSAAVSFDDQGRELIASSGIARRKTVTCHVAGRWLVYDSDERGFHNPLGLWNSGDVDIALVGNSWTQGVCIPSDKNFASLMRVRYPATLNLGMSGEGPLQILAITREYLSALRPKFLVWCYFEGNSLQELQEERKLELLLRYVRSDFSQGLLGRQDEIDQALSTFDQERKRQRERQAKDEARYATFRTMNRLIRLSTLRNAFGLVYGVDRQTQSMLDDLRGPTMDLFREIVAAVKSEVSSWGGTLVFVYLPSSERYPAWTRPTLTEDSQQRTRVLQLVAEASIPIVDLLPVFSARGNSLFRLGRFNEEGNRVIAEHVLDRISSIVREVGVTSRNFELPQQGHDSDGRRPPAVGPSAAKP